MKSIYLPTITAAAAALFIAALPAALLAAEPAGNSAAQVIVARAVNACFSAVVRVTGFLVPRDEAMVFLDLPGYKVTEVLVREGDRVTSGQILARLARQSGDGAEPAAGRPGAAPPMPATATLKAPAAGVVTRSSAVIGTVASSAMPEPLFRIAINNDIEVEVEVLSVHVPELVPGQTARVEIGGGRELTGRVRLAPAQIDSRTQLGRARLSLESDPSLRIGTFAKVAIDTHRSCGVSVPTSAILHRTQGTEVHVVRESTIQTRLVQVGLHSDTDTEIRDGVSEGDVIVANAGGSLRDRDKVTAIFADGTELGQR
jgi:multidrug efflux pump subunit AcrA (membrane-fusion protein)